MSNEYVQNAKQFCIADRQIYEIDRYKMLSSKNIHNRRNVAEMKHKMQSTASKSRFNSLARHRIAMLTWRQLQTVVSTMQDSGLHKYLVIA